MLQCIGTVLRSRIPGHTTNYIVGIWLVTLAGFVRDNTPRKQPQKHTHSKKAASETHALHDGGLTLALLRLRESCSSPVEIMVPLLNRLCSEK